MTILTFIVTAFLVTLITLALVAGLYMVRRRREFDADFRRTRLNIRRGSRRATAFNTLMLPFEVDNRGTDSMYPDNGVLIAFRNALVKTSTDDRHFAATSAQADIPRGVIVNDQVDTGEANAIKKTIGIFGIYPGTLPGVASAAIPRDAELVADPANAGQIIALPAAAGTYYVFGRARFAVINPGDPVSIIHCLPRAVTH